MDPAITGLLILGVIGALLIGSTILNSLSPSAGNERVIFSERCTIRYSILGLLRMAAPTPGFFSISDSHVTVKLIFTNRYRISDIRSAKVSSGVFSRHLAIKLWRSIATIHVYAKNPEETLKLLNEVRSRAAAD